MGEKPVRSVRTAEYDKLLQLLKDLRADSGLTQKEVCDRLGLEITFVSKVERGTRRLDVVEFFEYTTALGADPVQVLGSYRDLVQDRS